MPEIINPQKEMFVLTQFWRLSSWSGGPVASELMTAQYICVGWYSGVWGAETYGGRKVRAEEEGASFLVSPIKSLPPLPNILQLGPTSQRSYHLPRDPTLAPSL